MRPLSLVADLSAAIADAHSPRALGKAIAEALGAHLAVARVELRALSPAVVVVLRDDGWHVVDDAPSASLELAPGLAVDGAIHGGSRSGSGRLDGELRAAIGALVTTAVRHLDTVQRVADVSRRAHGDNRALRTALDRSHVVARSAAMRAVLARAELVARHPTTVLITGESGTGKEVVAREIHRLSPRARRPLVAINCGALPETLIESELFGHERGAFTGADRTRAGVFERADGGTLFLDEVGELSPAAQAKLLRVLQERRVRRVGGDRAIAVDVRVIAATHRPLDAMVAAGTFREDLFYRLHVFAIDVPPLRDRRDDIAPLAAALLADIAADLAMPPPSLSRAMTARLVAHAWPGNVRELRNALEAAAITGELALPDVRRRTATFADATRVAIEDALRATRGKLYGSGGAAARLGLEPSTLQSKMKKLGIVRGAFVRS